MPIYNHIFSLPKSLHTVQCCLQLLELFQNPVVGAFELGHYHHTLSRPDTLEFDSIEAARSLLFHQSYIAVMHVQLPDSDHFVFFDFIEGQLTLRSYDGQDTHSQLLEYTRRNVV